MASESQPQVILITGCSTGFGRALSEVALDRGFRVISTARRVETLEALRDKGATTLKLDVTAPFDELVKFAAEAWAVYGQVDYLINNAGYLLGGAIEESTPEEVQAQFNTNFFGLLNLTNAFLPHFRARRAGTIVNISSKGGTINMVGCGIYCATKAAVDSISDCWSRELKEFGIRCISIQPGSFSSAVGESSNVRRGSNRIAGYTAPDKVMVDFTAAAGTERGDTMKGSARIIDFVTAGGGKGRLPMRLTLGDDSYESVKGVRKQWMDEMEEFKSWGAGTDFD
ncbi:putative oxidoreductase,short chain dehydrogenase [Roridomyces roridus]|uniref:Oxidoreductase,short chain dehydrogenase n=1 Tax=Roridomyces roridus TaxID=1738132 RepID=A0AAD7BN26_9AGAR|nr:putative oxidoreductase,short chain dehydrogenase [Roridomyces roridus]